MGLKKCQILVIETCVRENILLKKDLGQFVEKEKEELANLWLGSHLSRVLIASASDHMAFWWITSCSKGNSLGGGKTYQPKPTHPPTHRNYG